jgi:hypothetical protein
MGHLDAKIRSLGLVCIPVGNIEVLDSRCSYNGGLMGMRFTNQDLLSKGFESWLHVGRLTPPLCRAVQLAGILSGPSYRNAYSTMKNMWRLTKMPRRFKGLGL